MSTFVAGLDLGGTHVSAGIMDENGRLHSRVFREISRESPPSEIIHSEIIPAILEAVTQASISRESIGGIGIGLPGNLDSEKGVCRFSPNLKWHDVQVREPIQEKLKKPVFILNDVRSATLGEYHFGAGRGLRHFACLAIGTGIGGGIIANGELVLGGSESAGEIGHITIYPDGPPCNCGNRGCLEALAAGPGIALRAEKALKSGRPSSMAPSAGKISARLVAEAARAGDGLALEIMRETGIILGIGLSSVITTVNPQKIAVGGRVALAGELLLEPAREEVRRRARLVPENFTEIVPAALREDAGLIGAATLALLKAG
jgi:glucokinase